MLRLQDGPSIAHRWWDAVRAPSAARSRHAFGLLSAAGALVVLSWRLSTPALWLDESASVIATQRTWGKLWVLFHGPDAPLVPYYALLKLLTGAVLAVDPHATSHPEVLYRWPSVLAGVLAVWVLIVGLARYCSVPLRLTIVAILLGVGGISRYGQEARPYAFVVLFAVVSTVLWTRVVVDLRWRWVPPYALSLALLAAANTLGAGLIAAHVVASVVAVEGGTRRQALLRTAAGAVAGMAVVSPVAVNATIHGSGGSAFFSLTSANLFRVFVTLFTVNTPPTRIFSALLLLSALGLIQVVLPGHRFIARLAACWAIVPTLVLLGALKLQPNLLIGRYILFTVPAWAILAALGAFTIGQDIPQWIIARSPDPMPARGERIVRSIGAGVGAAVVVGVLFLQLPTLHQVRDRSGHGEDIRPAIADIQEPQYAELPIIVSSKIESVGFATYDRKDEARFIRWRAQRNMQMIWPAIEDPLSEARQLRNDSRIILLLRANFTKCSQHANASAQYAQSCASWLFTTYQYRPVTVRPAGHGWWFLVLAKSNQPTSPPRSWNSA